MNYLGRAAFAGAFAIGLASAASAEVRLNAVSFAPAAADITMGFHHFVERFNEEFDGEAEIVWRGGPEVIPSFEQGNAVRSGAIDMAFVSPSFYSGLLPISGAPNFSQKNFEEIRATGYYERMGEIHREVGLELLGEIPATDVQFHIFLGEGIETLADLEGKRIRVFPAVLPFVRALGAEPIVMPQEEIFTAMERGLIDGFVRGTVGWAPQFEGVVTHYISPSFYRAGFPILVNPGSWGRIDPALQDRIRSFVMDTMAPEIDGMWGDQLAQGQSEMAAAGFSEILLDEDAAQAYIQTALDAAWTTLAEADADRAEELRAMLAE